MMDTRPDDGVVPAWTQVAIAFYLFGAMFVGSVLIASLVVDYDDPPTGAEEVAVMIPIQGIVSLAIVAAMAWIAFRIGRGRLGIPWWGKSGPGFWVLGAYVLAMLVWVPFSFLVYPTLLAALGVEMEPQEHLLYFTDAPRDLSFWFVFATVCLIGPLIEEIVFRGFLQTGLRRLFGRGAALVFVSILFGLIHEFDKALPLALMGAFFGWLRERDDGMGAPILAHCTHNTVTVLLTMQMPHFMNEAFGQ